MNDPAQSSGGHQARKVDRGISANPILAGKIPNENTNSTLDNYQPRDDDGIYAQQLIQAFLDVTGEAAGLMLTGTVGSGKTHLAVGIGREVLQRGGKAAFITFVGDGMDLDSIPGTPRSLGWYMHMDEMASVYDTIIIGDVPGELMPGVRSDLQDLILGAFNTGKKIVLTSNQPSRSLIRQIAVTPRVAGGSATDKEAGVAERMRQGWQCVEFTNSSYRSQRRKWWQSIRRPATMPGSIQESREIQRIAEKRTIPPELIARVLLELAEAQMVEGNAVKELREIIDE
jgi:hypothetical protein